ncbi:LolA family protein [Desertihabitans aurantiacus]|uniref:LolA family protein n=1 Tax=Desertihabitans aurantiacus TaxID=2282477 RepID=UPI000DF84283|nr:DUF2092 domain-containing protein [Desertihabitans aurantiacus]
MRRLTRWIPALAAPLLVVGGAVAVPLVADADPGLPDRTPEQVLELIATADDTSFSGTVEQTSELGLPELPEQLGQGDGSVTDLLTGTHTARVFVDGEKSRVQVMDRLAERDVVVNGEDVWLWSSDDQTAVHTTLPEHQRSGPVGDGGATPAEVADRLLEAAGPSTDIQVTDTATVAGRAVYQLTLDPRTDETLVDAATLSVDAETGMPLAVTIRAVGQNEPAFQIGFTEVDYATPDADRFEFTPPAGAEVVEKTLPEHDGPARDRDEGADREGPEPVVTGQDWATVVELPVGEVPEDAMVQQLTVPVEGGRALQTSLVSVLITEDGRVLAGAVPVDTLVAAAR